MSKVCVFCGKPPKNKNLEHVIPQWLLRHADVYDSVIKDVTTGQPYLFGPTFKNFKFPACEQCNSDFSALEVQAQRILALIENDQSLNMQDINTFMDWMDKVRIGVWLAILYTNKDIDDIRPHMFIKDRMGSKDRVLCIEKLTDSRGLMFSGASTTLFKMQPSAFQLFVGNYVFTSASSDFLVSKGLGFPFYSDIKSIGPDGETMVSIHKGLEKPQQGIVPTLLPNPQRIIFYQPIFKNYMGMDLYNSDYIKNNSMDFANGKGCIFYQNASSQIKCIRSEKTQIKLNLKPTQINAFKLTEKLIDLQIDIATKFSGIKADHPGAPEYFSAIEQLKTYKQKLHAANNFTR